MKHFLFALTVAVFANAPALADVANGGFESGAPTDNATTHYTRLAAGDSAMTGWTVASGNVDWLSAQAASPCQGSRSLDLNGNTNGAISQAVATTPGKAYRVTFCLASNSNGLPDVKTLEVSASGKPAIAFSFDRTGHSLGNPGWVRKQYWFVASEALTTISFASTTLLPEGAAGPNAYGPLIDDVAVGEFELAFPVVADQWWAPAQSGWGAAILQQGDTLFVCFFVYGTDGKPTWFVAVAAPQAGTPDGHVIFAGDLYATTGPYYGGSWEAAKVVERLAGTFKFDLLNVNAATIDYVVDGVPVHKNVTRQTWSTENLAGDYYGVIVWDQSNCVDTVDNGHYVAAGPVDIVHDPDNHVVVTFHAEDVTYNGARLDLPPDVRITLSGTYTQTGHLGTLQGRSTTEIPGEPPDLGNTTLHQLERSVSGIVSRYQKIDDAGGCRANGRFAAARR